MLFNSLCNESVLSSGKCMGKLISLTITEGSFSGATLTCSRAEYLDTQGFSSGRELPAQQRDPLGASSSLRRCWWGLCLDRTINSHPHMCEKLPRKCRRPEHDTSAWVWGCQHCSLSKRACKEGCSDPISSRGKFSWCSLPSQKEYSYGIHPQKSSVLSACWNGCGNSDKAPMKTCSRPGLRLQGLPEHFKGNWWERWVESCSGLPGTDNRTKPKMESNLIPLLTR